MIERVGPGEHRALGGAVVIARDHPCHSGWWVRGAYEQAQRAYLATGAPNVFASLGEVRTTLAAHRSRLEQLLRSDA